MPLTRVATGPTGLEVFAARDVGVVHFVLRAGDVPNDDFGFRRSLSKQIQATVPDSQGGSASDCGFLLVTLPAGPASDEMATFETTAVLPPRHHGDATPDEKVDEHDVRAKMLAARSIRRRRLLVNVSSTQTTADPEPLVSVSFGWADKDEEM
jgi:hypothetical protein